MVSIKPKHEKKDISSISGFDERFTDRLNTIIQKIGTLKEAATIADVTYEQLSKWRDRKSKPSFFGMAALAKAAGVSLNWLAYEENNYSKSPMTDSHHDPEILQIAVESLEQYLADRSLIMAPVQKGKAVSALYNMAIHNEIQFQESLSDSVIDDFLKSSKKKWIVF